MSDGVKEYLSTIHNPNKGPPKRDPFLDYRTASDLIRSGPPFPDFFLDLLKSVLIKYAKGKGELAITMNGDYACFELDGKSFTNFGIILLSTIRVHLLDQTRYELELMLWGENLTPKTIRLDFNALDSRSWLIDLGPKYICEQSKIVNIRAIIQAMAQYAPVRDEYLYTGWVSDKDAIYIMGNNQLIGNDWSKEEAKVPCLHTFEMLDVAPHSLTIPLLSIALLSLVQSRMMDKGVYFKGVCCITAPTQSFKSTLAALFFNFENGREANINFEATMAAIVRTVGNTRDSTTIVDDFKPAATKSENNEMVRKLSTIIRMCSDDSGGVQKAGVQNTTFSNMAHGLVVVTAEQVQLHVQSTLARLLVLEMNRKSVDVEKLTRFQDEHKQYRDFIKDFVQYIAAQGADQFCEHLAQRFLQERHTLRMELSESVPVDNRTSDMVTWLWIAFGEFLSYARNIEAVTDVQLEAYTQEARIVFMSLMEQQAERVANLSPVKQFFRGLQVLLETKEARIGELQARNSRFSVADSKKAIGFSKNDFIYLKNGMALQAVVSYYRRFGKEFTVSESSLRKALADGGYIIPKDEKSCIHRLSVNHESYQCIKIERKKFYQLLRGGQINGTMDDTELPSDRAVRKNADVIIGR